MLAIKKKDQTLFFKLNFTYASRADILSKFQEARAIAYADDGYIKAKLSISLQVLVELKVVFKTHTLWSSTSLRPPSFPKVSLPRLCLIWCGPSSKEPPPLHTSSTTFSSIPSDLKVSLVLTCLWTLISLHGVLCSKHVGIS